MTTTYIAIDAEFWWSEELHLMHKSMDPKSQRRAVAVKEVMAAAAFAFTVDDDGCVSTDRPLSWAEPEMNGEAGVSSALFDYLRGREDDPILTYGGLATDVPILLLSAIRHGLRLPPQLLDQPGRRGPRPHLDLGLMLKGGGRTWSHLSQVLLRMGVPLALVKAKAKVARPHDEVGWRSVREHAELDCLLLAIAKIGWLVAQGASGLRLEASIVALVEGFVRKRPDHERASTLLAYSKQLQRTIAAELDRAA